jgi:hypothetical protein
MEQTDKTQATNSNRYGTTGRWFTSKGSKRIRKTREQHARKYARKNAVAPLWP